MAWFNLPLKKRFTKIFDRENSLFLCSKFVEVDGIGVIVEYDHKRNLTPEKIRQCSRGITDTYCIVEAETPEEAIKIFLQNWEGAQGEHPAFWIRDKDIILKYPFCEFLNQSREGKFICGPEVCGEGYGIRGMCVLEWGIDPPPAGYCPIDEMKIDKNKAEKITVGGKEYFFVDASKI